MLTTALLTTSLALAAEASLSHLSFPNHPTHLQFPRQTNSTSMTPAQVCQQIAQKVSPSSAVIDQSSPNFADDIHHWYGSSTQTPACVLEAGSPQDIGLALQVVAASKTPFCVKSGGHASNAGFSSTTGVHISLRLFNATTLSPDNKTATIGFGQGWADVYKALEPTGYNVVGGRVAGPGVGGFTLGGGYSWKTNQYGLTSDTVVGYEVVLPNGTVSTASARENADLFFALKGGLNRFGIVTSANFSTHPQPSQIYGGIALYGAKNVDAVLDATARFYAENKDEKAQIITTLNGAKSGTSALVLFFYDGPQEPTTFHQFGQIKAAIDLRKAQTFSSFVSGVNSALQSPKRGTFNTVSTSKITPGFVAAVKNQTDYFGSISKQHSGTSISFDIEPFLPYGEKAVSSAFPHSGSPLPLNLYFAWTEASEDQFWYEQMRQSVALLKQVAVGEGIAGDYTAYPNYAIANTTAVELYGAENTQRLQSIKRAIDPTNIMGLTGGLDLGACGYKE